VAGGFGVALTGGLEGDQEGLERFVHGPEYGAGRWAGSTGQALRSPVRLGDRL
jgi:hypothetical protein